ncbi:endoplasmic reticulum vesicle transporter-domain-containing protein [Peziza echinospora]|nr:endoplasmic reticulum vesicle transporter-domain-containing protein [Peziza echinospora]
MDDKEFSFSESVRTFDAFPKTRQSYTVRTSRGGAMTLLITLACILLLWVEFGVYFDGIETQHFLVEPRIGSHNLQINIDITVAMPCDDLHVNVQDAVGDRIFAGNLLRKEVTRFDPSRVGSREPLEHKDMWHIMGSGGGKKGSWKKTQKWKGGLQGCRIWGSMDVNRVQGDFHITAKGHGYWDASGHVDHTTFNFSHIVDELSFGEFYPKLINPLDNSLEITEKNFWKYQYYLSLVPTTYTSTTTSRHLKTHQYAVTESSKEVSDLATPGIFFKFDIEPVSLEITDTRTPLLTFFVRMVNIVGGVLVSGGWFYKFWDFFLTSVLKRRPGGVGGAGRGGVLDGRRKEDGFED